jgi:hypothetical protein
VYRNAVDTFLKPGALRHDNADADVEVEMAQSVFREASGIWLRCVDKQLSLMLGRPGLSSIEYDESWEKMHPLDWPKMWAHPDQGSDGQCAASFLRRKSKPCNLALLWDISHGCWNDAKLTLKHLGLWLFVQLVTLVINMVHGPWEEAKWYQKLKDAADEVTRGTTPENNALWLHYLKRALHDAFLAG